MSKLMTRSTILPFLMAAAFCVASLPQAVSAAADPAEKCEQGIVKTMASCVKKAAKLSIGCYKKTGADCASNDEKVNKTRSSVTTKVRSKCADDAAVADAGYGSVGRSGAGSHFAESCIVHGRVIVERALGVAGRGYQAASEEDQKCLLAAAKTAGTHAGKALKGLAKCAKGEDCSAATAAALFDAIAPKNAGKVDKKCADLSGLIGQDAAAFIDEVSAQVPSMVASPCDALDETRCAFPFPSNYFTIPGAATDSGRQVNIGARTLPRNAGTSAVSTRRFNEADGFSIGPMLMIGEEDLDLTMTGAAPITDLAESLESDTPVLLIDAETGEQQLLFVERDLRGATIDDQAIIARVGKNLKDAHRYIVAMRGLKNAGGDTLAANAIFAAYRDDTPTGILPVELRRPQMEEIFTTLEGFGVAREELYLAWDFTTQSSESVAGRMLAMRDDAFGILDTDAPVFTVDTVEDAIDARVFRRIDGTFQVPLYLNDGGAVGSSLRIGPDGYPLNEGDFFTANYRCIIPFAATTAGVAPAIPARPSLYGHGLLGSHTEGSSGNVRDFSNEHNFILCATDWTGFASDDFATAVQVVSDFTVFPNFIDRQHQGILNFQFLGRLLQHASGFASDPAFQLDGVSLIDPSELFYDGNSQGGILGGVLAAFSQDIERFSLGVPGINYSTLLYRSVDFDAFDGTFSGAYPSATDRNLLFSAAQMIWDRTDPNGHINHVTADPYPGTSAKKLLYQVAFGDHQVAPVTAEIAARTNGMSIHAPVLKPGKVVPEVTPYFDIPAIPSYPFDGSAIVIWDSGNPPAPIGNVPPPTISAIDPEWADLGPCPMGAGGADPHSCPRNNASARVQKSEFLKTGGMVTDVCGGAACEAP